MRILDFLFNKNKQIERMVNHVMQLYRREIQKGSPQPAAVYNVIHRIMDSKYIQVSLNNINTLETLCIKLMELKHQDKQNDTSWWITVIQHINEEFAAFHDRPEMGISSIEKLLKQYGIFDTYLKDPTLLGPMPSPFLFKQTYEGLLITGYDSISENAVIPPKYKDKPIIGIIAEGIFANCVTISIPSTVERIEPYAFYGAANLEKITVDPNNKKYKATSSYLYEVETQTIICGFDNCIITSGDEPVTSIYPYAYSLRKNINQITITHQIKEIGKYAFFGCENLKEIKIQESLIQKIDEGTFENCTKLQKVSSPLFLRELGAKSFKNCSNIEEISLTIRLRKIGPEAFINCTSLKSIGCISFVDEFGECAFANCASLKNIEINGNCSIQKLQDNSHLYNTEANPIIPYTTVSISQKSTRLPVDIEAIVGSASHIALRENISTIPEEFYRNTLYIDKLQIAKRNPYYAMEGNCLIDKRTETILRGCARSTIPENYRISKIGKRSFYDLPIKTLTIPENILYIEDEAFAYCNDIESISIPNSIENIESMAFNGWTGNQEITIARGCIDNLWSPDWNKGCHAHITNLNSTTPTSKKKQIYSHYKEIRNDDSIIEAYINDHHVIFDYSDHSYLVDGIQVPSVTQLMKEYGYYGYDRVPSSTLANAAYRGTMMHKRVENYVKTGYNCGAPEVDGYIRLQKQYNIIPIAQELMVIIFDNNKPICAGRLDYVYDIPNSFEVGLGDLKRTYRYMKYNVSIQLNLYKIGFEQCYGLDVSQMSCLRLRDEVAEYHDVPIDTKDASYIIKKESSR